MKLYLSSYRLGDYGEKLKKLVNKPNAKVAVSVNALDWSDDLSRVNANLNRALEDMRSLGFKPEALDLRNYFGKNNLLEKMKQYDAIWVSGGNTFILAKAYKQSGFDKVLDKLVKTDKLVYAGYSAAFCVLASSLKGVEIVDDKDAGADGYEPGEIWKGFGLIDFYPIVHFRSVHEESDSAEVEYEYIKSNKINFKTFKDGDVYIVDGSNAQVLANS